MLLRRGAWQHFDLREAGVDQRVEAAADDFEFLLDRETAKAGRLGRCHQDPQRTGPWRDHVGGNRGQYVADEMNVFGGKEAAARRVVGKLPRLLGDPRHHRREDEVELAAVLARARLVVQPPHVALEQCLEEIGAELDQLRVLRQRALFAIGVGLDALVHVDDGAEVRVFLARVGVEAHRNRHPCPAVGREDSRVLLSPGRGGGARHVGFEPVHDDDVKGVAVHRRRRERRQSPGGGDRRPEVRSRRSRVRHGRRVRRARVARRLGDRIDRRRERVVLGRDVLAARNLLAVFRDLGRDLVAHDRVRIALGRAHDRFLRERRQDLFDRLLCGPALGAVEVRDRLAPIDLLDQFHAHVFVFESQGVPGFVSHDPPEFRLGRAHREAFEVERRLALLDAFNLGTDVRPVARQFLGLVEPGDADLADARGLDELHVCSLRPGVHVQQDAGAQVARRTVEKLHGQPHAGRGPLVSDHDGKPPRSAAASDRSSGQDALLVRILRIDLDTAAQDLGGLLGSESPRPADDL